MSILERIDSRLTWEFIETQRFGAMPFILLIQSCFGSVAVCAIFGLGGNQVDIPLFIVSLVTILANGICIAQAPMKQVVGSFVVSMLVSLIALIYALCV